MNKKLLTIAVLGLLVLFTSAYYSAPADSRVGYKAPRLVLGNSNNDLSPLQLHQGEYVLLTFWSSADACSRLDNLHYDRLAREDGSAYIHVSVNLDRSTSVFNSVVTLDNLDRSANYSTTLEAQEVIIRNWRLENGFHSFLIDPQGCISAIDPDEQLLASL